MFDSGERHLPDEGRYGLAVKLQLKLGEEKTKPFSDPLIAAICINRGEGLVDTGATFTKIPRSAASEIGLRAKYEAEVVLGMVEP